MKKSVLAVMMMALWIGAGPGVMAGERVKLGDTAFAAYEGRQNWPTADQVQVIKDYAVPIYLGLPRRPYKVLGRIYDTRTSGIDVVGRAFDEGLGKESRRMRNVANRAKLEGADAVVVTDNEKVLETFKLSRRELKDSAPLFEHKRKIVLAVKLE